MKTHKRKEREGERETSARKKHQAHDLSCTVHHSLHKTIKMCVRLWNVFEIYMNKWRAKVRRRDDMKKQANHNAAEGKHA